MRFSVLASGSRANATFIESGDTRVLIDCGLSLRNLTARLEALGVCPSTLSAILVTHEHTDHIRGVGTLSKKFRLPVYMNEGTHQSEAVGRIGDRMFAMEQFETGKCFTVGGFEVHPFSIIHDAVDPVGFVLKAQGTRFGQVTDLGKVTPLVEASLENCNALVVEANHDEDMLQTCRYPWELKQRIASHHGHLSNRAAGGLLKRIWNSGLDALVLGHLSEESNTPDRAIGSVREALELPGGMGYRLPKFFTYGTFGSSTPMYVM